jgi:putative transposase
MTVPRRVLPGETYFITRRCSERRFFLVPDAVVRRILLYCLAMAAARTGVELHAVCAMSNHYHLVLTDVRGNLPMFMAWLNRHAANCLKLHRRRVGPIWDASEKYSAVALLSREAVWEKVIYTLTNPVKAGLVRRHCQWPGLNLGPKQWREGPLHAEHPGLYFKRTDEPSPTIRLTRPPLLAHQHLGRLVKRLLVGGSAKGAAR